MFSIVNDRFMAVNFGMFWIQAAADRFAQDHFLEICQHEEFLRLSTSQVIDLISRDHLNVRQEEDVYKAVIDWLEFDSGWLFTDHLFPYSILAWEYLNFQAYFHPQPHKYLSDLKGHSNE